MNTELTKAAQQALEALRSEQSLRNGYTHSAGGRIVSTAEEAIAALERALAQRPAAQEVGEREAFEARYAKHYPGTYRDTGGTYGASDVLNIAWGAWQARASLTAPQQATPEPVGEVVAYREKLTGRLCEPDDTHRRKFPMCYEPLIRLADAPAIDIKAAAQKLMGWRTENFLWETDDVDKARNWEPNIGVLPIFEGDPNTKLGSRGITAQGAQGGEAK